MKIHKILNTFYQIYIYPIFYFHFSSSVNVYVIKYGSTGSQSRGMYVCSAKMFWNCKSIVEKWTWRADYLKANLRMSMTFFR